MAVGKNKKLGKKKKGGSRKATDPFLKKEWYEVKAPSVFPTREIGRTVVTKTIGNRVARDSLLGRVFEASLGDLKPAGEDDAFRKFSFKVEEVSGTQCLTSFYKMDLTTDKLRSLVRKWHTLIEAHVDVKTTDGFTLRLFCIGFTKRRPNQTRKTSYAQSSQVRAIRKKMMEIMTREASSVDLTGLVEKFIPEIIGREIEKATQGIYPLQNVFIRKVKVLKAPKLDLGKLLETHGGADAVAAAEKGTQVERPEESKEAAPKKGAKKRAAAKAKKEAEE
jgi:small subunit ribosomal protein S3Ae